MNQTCRVCGEPAAGFHFGAFTCEGCKSFFGRSYSNLSSISECKNNGKCIIDKKNRTTCKACRLRKCYTVGMSKGGSRYGRRSNWFKIHCLLQEHQQQALEAASKAAAISCETLSPNSTAGDPAAHLQHQRHQTIHQSQLQRTQQQQQHQQQQQQRNNVAAAQLAAAHGIFNVYPGYAQAHAMQHPGAHAHAHVGALSVDMLRQTSATTPFINAAAGASSARHPVAEAAAFFSMMNSPQSVFQLPPHLLFPAAAVAAAGYHPNAAAAAAAADAAYRSEMYRHRLSVDSAASSDSPRYAASASDIEHAQTQQRTSRVHSTASSLASAKSPKTECQSPELCVSGDDNEPHERQEHAAVSPQLVPQPTTALTIHSPIPIRATSAHLNGTKIAALSPVALAADVPTPTSTPTRSSLSRSPESAAVVITNYHSQYHHFEPHASSQKPQQPQSQLPPTRLSAEQTALAFAAKMQSLSPVSVCSIGGETAAATGAVASDQACPIDLSMKSTTRHSDDEANEAPAEVEPRECVAQRRKFFQLHSEHSEASTSSVSSTASSLTVATMSSASYQQQPPPHETELLAFTNNNSDFSATDSLSSITQENAKRQKLSSAKATVVDAAAVASVAAPKTTTAAPTYNTYAAAHSATSLHGIFVCV